MMLTTSETTISTAITIAMTDMTFLLFIGMYAPFPPPARGAFG